MKIWWKKKKKTIIEIKILGFREYTSGRSMQVAVITIYSASEVYYFLILRFIECQLSRADYAR